MTIYLKTVLFLIFVLLQNTNLYAKNNNLKNVSSFKVVQLVDSINKEIETLEVDSIFDVVRSTPYSLEVAILITGCKVKYPKESLNKSKNVINYTTTYQKALNLGVYSADLEYATLYEQNQEVDNYLSVIKKLATDLDIEKFFDYAAIKQRVQNNGDLPSLLELNTQSFKEIYIELTKQKRQDISILMITGNWIESLYTTSLVYKQSNNEGLKNKIGENKLVLDKILLLLKVHEDKPNFKSLIDQLELLKKTYQNVEVTKKQGRPRMEVVKGEIVIIDTEENEATISKQEAVAICDLVASIRTKIITN